MANISQLWERFTKWLKARWLRLWAKKPASIPAVSPPPAVIADPGVLVQTVRRGRIGSFGIQTSPMKLVSRIPKIGDKVWWAPKQLWCEVAKIDIDTINFIFIGGEPVRTSDGQIRPRWSVNTGLGGHFFHEPINAWVVGRGQMPRNIRGKIITPDVIKLTMNPSTGDMRRA